VVGRGAGRGRDGLEINLRAAQPAGHIAYRWAGARSPNNNALTDLAASSVALLRKIL
jgi:hypothetical protein